MISASKNKDDELFYKICNVVLNSDLPVPYMEAVCVLIGADSATLWSNTETSFSNEFYFLRTHFNRPDIEKLFELNKSPSMSIENDNIVSSNAISNKQIIRGTIGEAPFNGEWLKKDYTKELLPLKFKYIVIAPVFSYDDEPIHIISFYFKNAPNLTDSFVRGTTNLISSINESVEKRLREDRLEKRKDRHEVLFHSRVISNKFSRISHFAKSIYKKANKLEGMDNLESESNELRSDSEEAKKSIDILRSSYKKNTFRERIKDRSTRIKYINLCDVIISAREVSVSEFNPIHNVSAGNIFVDKNIEILFHLDDLTMLLSNLYNNASKHSMIGSVVRTSSKFKKGSFVLLIENDIPSDVEDDLNAIWEYEMRGRAPRESDVPGEGLGLGIVSDICKVYRIRPSALYKRLDNKHSKVFSVSLEIPSKLIRRI